MARNPPAHTLSAMVGILMSRKRNEPKMSQLNNPYAKSKGRSRTDDLTGVGEDFTCGNVRKDVPVFRQAAEEQWYDDAHQTATAESYQILHHSSLPVVFNALPFALYRPTLLPLMRIPFAPVDMDSTTMRPPECVDDLDDGAEARITFLSEAFVQALAAHASLLGYLTHATRLGHISDGNLQECWITGLRCNIEVCNGIILAFDAFAGVPAANLYCLLLMVDSGIPYAFLTCGAVRSDGFHAHYCIPENTIMQVWRSSSYSLLYRNARDVFVGIACFVIRYTDGSGSIFPTHVPFLRLLVFLP